MSVVVDLALHLRNIQHSIFGSYLCSGVSLTYLVTSITAANKAYLILIFLGLLVFDSGK